MSGQPERIILIIQVLGFPSDTLVLLRALPFPILRESVSSKLEFRIATPIKRFY